MVDGEADGFCAAAAHQAAKESGLDKRISIFTNDSDLVRVQKGESLLQDPDLYAATTYRARRLRLSNKFEIVANSSGFLHTGNLELWATDSNRDDQ